MSDHDDDAELARAIAESERLTVALRARQAAARAAMAPAAAMVPLATLEALRRAVLDPTTDRAQLAEQLNAMAKQGQKRQAEAGAEPEEEPKRARRDPAARVSVAEMMRGDLLTHPASAEDGQGEVFEVLRIVGSSAIMRKAGFSRRMGQSFRHNDFRRATEAEREEFLELDAGNRYDAPAAAGAAADAHRLNFKVGDFVVFKYGSATVYKITNTSVATGYDMDDSIGRRVNVHDGEGLRLASQMEADRWGLGVHEGAGAAAAAAGGGAPPPPLLQLHVARQEAAAAAAGAEGNRGFKVGDLAQFSYSRVIYTVTRILPDGFELSNIDGKRTVEDGEVEYLVRPTNADAQEYKRNNPPLPPAGAAAGHGFNLGDLVKFAQIPMIYYTVVNVNNQGLELRDALGVSHVVSYDDAENLVSPSEEEVNDYVNALHRFSPTSPSYDPAYDAPHSPSYSPVSPRPPASPAGAGRISPMGDNEEEVEQESYEVGDFVTNEFGDVYRILSLSADKTFAHVGLPNVRLEDVAFPVRPSGFRRSTPAEIEKFKRDERTLAAVEAAQDVDMAADSDDDKPLTHLLPPKSVAPPAAAAAVGDGSPFEMIDAAEAQWSPRAGDLAAAGPARFVFRVYARLPGDKFTACKPGSDAPLESGGAFSLAALNPVTAAERAAFETADARIRAGFVSGALITTVYSEITTPLLKVVPAGFQVQHIGRDADITTRPASYYRIATKEEGVEYERMFSARGAKAKAAPADAAGLEKGVYVPGVGKRAVIRRTNQVVTVVAVRPEIAVKDTRGRVLGRRFRSDELRHASRDEIRSATNEEDEQEEHGTIPYDDAGRAARPPRPGQMEDEWDEEEDDAPASAAAAAAASPHLRMHQGVEAAPEPAWVPRVGDIVSYKGPGKKAVFLKIVGLIGASRVEVVSADKPDEPFWRERREVVYAPDGARVFERLAQRAAAAALRQYSSSDEDEEEVAPRRAVAAAPAWDPRREQVATVRATGKAGKVHARGFDYNFIDIWRPETGLVKYAEADLRKSTREEENEYQEVNRKHSIQVERAEADARHRGAAAAHDLKRRRGQGKKKDAPAADAAAAGARAAPIVVGSSQSDEEMEPTQAAPFKVGDFAQSKLASPGDEALQVVRGPDGQLELISGNRDMIAPLRHGLFRHATAAEIAKFKATEKRVADGGHLYSDESEGDDEAPAAAAAAAAPRVYAQLSPEEEENERDPGSINVGDLVTLLPGGFRAGSTGRVKNKNAIEELINPADKKDKRTHTVWSYLVMPVKSEAGLARTRAEFRPATDAETVQFKREEAAWLALQPRAAAGPRDLDGGGGAPPPAAAAPAAAAPLAEVALECDVKLGDIVTVPVAHFIGWGKHGEDSVFQVLEVGIKHHVVEGGAGKRRKRVAHKYAILGAPGVGMGWEYKCTQFRHATPDEVVRFKAAELVKQENDRQDKRDGRYGADIRAKQLAEDASSAAAAAAARYNMCTECGKRKPDVRARGGDEDYVVCDDCRYGHSSSSSSSSSSSDGEDEEPPAAAAAAAKPKAKGKKKKFKRVTRRIPAPIVDGGRTPVDLIRDGIAVVPLLSLAEVQYYNARILAAFQTMPEFKPAAHAAQTYVLGGFGALGNASSFHLPIIRELHALVKQRTSAFFQQLCERMHPGERDWRLEQMMDRVSLRRVGTFTSSESWHRDQSPTQDTVYGGWVNLDALAGQHQFFSCVPGSQPAVAPAGVPAPGFIKPVFETEAQLIEVEAECCQFRIPLGHWVVFNQNLLHEVNKSKATYNSLRKYLGFRLTKSRKALFEEKHPGNEFDADWSWKRDVFLQQGAPPLPSAQRPPMFGLLHQVNHRELLKQFSLTLKDEMLDDKDVAFRFAPALGNTSFDMYRDYTEAEIDSYRPQPIFAAAAAAAAGAGDEDMCIYCGKVVPESDLLYNEHGELECSDCSEKHDRHVDGEGSDEE